MKHLIRTTFLCLTLALVLGVPTVSAQSVIPAPEAKPSPVALSRAMVGDSYVKVTYGSPRKRDRVIFGGLEAWGSIWRTGANEATELTITEPIMVGGEELTAGTYSLFSEINRDEWTIILNSAVNQWGSYGYDDELDVLRVNVPTETTADTYEALTIGFEGGDEDGNNPTHLYIVWDQTRVRVPLAAAEG